VERLLDVAEVMAHYHLKSRQTAYKRMDAMDTQVRIGGKRLVPQGAVERYDRAHETHPPELIRAAMRRARETGGKGCGTSSRRSGICSGQKCG